LIRAFSGKLGRSIATDYVRAALRDRRAIFGTISSPTRTDRANEVGGAKECGCPTNASLGWSVSGAGVRRICNCCHHACLEPRSGTARLRLLPIGSLRTAMKLIQKIKESWSAVRWKMLVIFAFFSVISTILVASGAAAVLNVVIRRANANLIEERINGIVDSYNRFTPYLLDQVATCQTPPSNSPVLEEYPAAVWPEGESSVSVLPKGARAATKPSWLDADSFAGIVVDRGNLEIRSFRSVEREGCSMSALVRIRLTESFLKRLSTEVGLQISGNQPMLTQQYRAHRIGDWLVISKPISFLDRVARFRS
jgi:hypothetical protein